MKIAILKNEESDSADKWIVSCKKYGVDYVVIDLTKHNWFEQIQQSQASIYLLRPSKNTSHYKMMYDERIYVLSKVLNAHLYPTYEECYIYENKKLLSYFLETSNIPHPKTRVFYSQIDALIFLQTSVYPLVSKTSIGASGTGVRILRNYSEAEAYIKKAFSKKGIKRRFGPNRQIGSIRKWTLRTIESPRYFMNKIKKYLYVHQYGERDFVLFQDYIPHDFEWRIVVIGDSYFAHKKIKSGEKSSGSLIKHYDNPPLKLFNFAKRIMEITGFYSQAIDVFETEDGRLLVNELQCIFGQSDPYQMLVDGKAGRYVFVDNQWVFQEGDYNTNESFDLRLQHVLTLLNKE